MRAVTSRCQLKSTKEYSPTNASIDRMENCMTGVHLHKEQLLLLQFIYSLCQFMQCPLFFACQNIFLNTRGVIGIEYWGDLTIWFLNLRIRIRNIFTKAVAKTHSFTKWEGPTFLNLDQIFNIGLSLNCKQRCCMYWDRPLTVLLLIPGPPTNCQFQSPVDWRVYFPCYWEAHHQSLFDKNLIYVAAGQQLDAILIPPVT